MVRKFCKKLKFYKEARKATKGPLRRKPVRKLQPVRFTCIDYSQCRRPSTTWWKKSGAYL